MRPAALAALAAALLPAWATAGPDEVPFPVDKTTILRIEKTVYTVEGRVRIPKGVTVACQKDVYIRAKGKGPAVIEVEGALDVHGVTDREVIFEGVTVEPAAAFDQVQLANCIFRGGGVTTPSGRPCDGRMRLEGVLMEKEAKIDLSFSSGVYDLINCSTGNALRLTGVDPPGGPNKVKVTVRGCTSYGIEARNVADLTVRINKVRSDPATFKDCPVLIFDGNKVEAKRLVFEQSKAGTFQRTQVMKCDLYCAALVFRCPAEKGKADSVVVDKCWFQGKRARPDLEAIVQDAADDPSCGVRVTVQNPQERPLELAGAVNR